MVLQGIDSPDYSMKKKSVLFFHQSGAIGGAGVSLIHVLNSLDRSRYSICVVCPSVPNDMVKALEGMKVKVIPTDNTPILFPHYNGGIKYAFSIRTMINAIQLIRDKRTVCKIIEREKPDIVAVNSMALSHIGRYAKKNNIRTVCFDRETFQKGFLGIRTSIIKKWMSNYFDKVVFISKYDFSQMDDGCGCEKIIIYDKVDLKCYEIKDRMDLIDEENVRILFLGGISRIKGSHILIEAARILQNEKIEFFLVGDEASLITPMTWKDSIASKLKLTSLALTKAAYHRIDNKEHIHFIPPSVRPEEYYLNSDIVVFPSTVAHQARPVYEAGAARKPIIISDFIETKEFCEDKRNVICFKACDYKDLANKIRYLIKNKEMWACITSNNYMRTQLYHNLKDLPGELTSVFEEDYKEEAGDIKSRKAE